MQIFSVIFAQHIIVVLCSQIFPVFLVLRWNYRKYLRYFLQKIAQRPWLDFSSASRATAAYPTRSRERCDMEGSYPPCVTLGARKCQPTNLTKKNSSNLYWLLVQGLHVGCLNKIQDLMNPGFSAESRPHPQKFSRRSWGATVQKKKEKQMGFLFVPH